VTPAARRRATRTLLALLGLLLIGWGVVVAVAAVVWEVAR
jgi:ribosomal protein L30/L7E